ncbi:MAG: flagellar biosynthesis protein FlhF [Pirellulales bacterium]|nr:flagellar biosynthesis protein FlhF [Pirellulales bacterium]
MELKTFRAANMQEALALVRRELGPQAAVLHTREVRASGLRRLVPGARQIEVTASNSVNVPSRLPARQAVAAAPMAVAAAPPDHLQSQLADLQAMVEDLCRRTQNSSTHELPERLFHIFTDLIEADVPEELARELVDRVRREAPRDELGDDRLVRGRLCRMIEGDIRTSGPLRVTPGQCRVVALVGPTGVGKTTTVAKLAAQYRLREKRAVGLITVDTYRIAAVEQLRTYADIIDLPMHVVSTPREMRKSIEQMQHLELILMDTAGRSPRDEVKIQELKVFLQEARADEVHLVLSSVAGAASLARTAERFATAGTTSLLFTKLDEATGLGNLLPVIREAGLPLSYVTNGQNVPDDIEAADARELASIVLGDVDLDD